MNHSFDIQDAEKYGVNAAIILQNFKFWQTRAQANGAHFHDGRYWVYNSVRALGLLFPYLTAKQIRIALDLLVEKGALVAGNHNQSQYDRTKWYSCVDLDSPAHLPHRANEIAAEGKPIPDITTDIGNTSPVPPAQSVSKEVPYDAIFDAYNEQLPMLAAVQLRNDKRKQAIKARWFEILGTKSPKGKVRYADPESGVRWWTAFFFKVTSNPHWTGSNDRGWQADFDWIMKPANFAKILEYQPVKTNG